MNNSIFNGLFLLIYLMSAVVQYNDPDGILWIALYLSAAGMCLGEIRGWLPRWFPLFLLTLCLLWIALLLPRIIGEVSFSEIVESVSMKTTAVEEAREIGGLLLVAIWAGVLAARKYSN